MTKFKVLKSNQTYMTYLGVYTKRLTEPINELHKSIFCYCLFVIMSISATGCATFIYRDPTNVKAALRATKTCCGIFQCTGMFIGVGCKMIKVKALHLRLQQIVDEGICKSNVIKRTSSVAWPKYFLIHFLRFSQSVEKFSVKKLD